MRTYRLDALTSIDDLVIHNEAVPDPQRGEVLVKVHAVSLNYRDLSLVLGNYPWTVKPGLVPCSDAAGEIVAVGEGVTAYRPGDRVISTFHPRWFGGRIPIDAVNQTYGNGSDGWLTEFKLVSQESIIKLPEVMSWEEGATLPCAGLTAWNARSGTIAARAGQTVLTLGTGGVSVFAVQLAKAFGATVIGTTSSNAKAEVLKRLGADHVVNYAEKQDWGRYVKETLTGGIGVDVVVEVGGPATVNQSLDAVRWGGEVVLIGFLSKENPGIDYFHLKKSGAIVRSLATGDRAQLEDLVRAVTGGGVKPVIDQVYPFDEARAAFIHLKNGGHIGKIVIKVTP